MVLSCIVIWMPGGKFCLPLLRLPAGVCYPHTSNVHFSVARDKTLTMRCLSPMELRLNLVVRCQLFAKAAFAALCVAS